MRRDGQAARLQGNSAGPVDVLLVCPHLGDGGVQRVVSTLANGWNRGGKAVCVATLYEMDLAYDLDPGVRFMPAINYFWVKWIEKLRLLLPIPGSLKTSAFGRFIARLLYPLVPFLYIPLHIRVLALRSVIRRCGAPVVIGFCGSTNIVTALAGEPLPCRVIISERNDPARQELDFPWEPLRPRYYNRADVVSANTRGALEAMRSYVDPHKLVYVPNPVRHLTELGGAEGLSMPRQNTILAVGRLHPQKAHDVLLDAFARLGPACAGWRLSIVGRGELEAELRRQAERLGIAARVDWHGQVKDPFPFYRAAGMFVLPSRHEGTPNALLEAMCLGMAVVVSNASPGPLELVEHGRSGLVVPVDDSTRLAQTIEALAADPQLRARLGRAAQERFAEYDRASSPEAWERLMGWRTRADESTTDRFPQSAVAKLGAWNG